MRSTLNVTKWLLRSSFARFRSEVEKEPWTVRSTLNLFVCVVCLKRTEKGYHLSLFAFLPVNQPITRWYLFQGCHRVTISRPARYPKSDRWQVLSNFSFVYCCLKSSSVSSLPTDYTDFTDSRSRIPTDSHKLHKVIITYYLLPITYYLKSLCRLSEK